VAQDSSLPAFWDARYRDGVTPWDAGGVPPQLLEWLKTAVPRKVLMPGCGTGYEVRAFAQHGHDVTAIEFSDAAIEAARRELGPLADRLKKADFFSFATASFDLVYERAFMCALPRRMWPQWAARVAALVRPGGELAGFFYFNDNARGPPFGISAAALGELLSPRFELTEDLPIPQEQSLPVFKGKERWQVWTRRL
jgi:SAM-dependent methyltransferase